MAVLAGAAGATLISLIFVMSFMGALSSAWIFVMSFTGALHDPARAACRSESSVPRQPPRR